MISLGLTGDRGIASDEKDEAFARAWRHWDRVKEMASPDGWTYRVALNVARSRARRRRVERRLLPRLVNRASVPAPAGEVWALVRDLPARQRVAVVLRYVGDFGERERTRERVRDRPTSLRVVLSECQSARGSPSCKACSVMAWMKAAFP
ncbi:MAG: sigma factor [Acidimicrobiia bacterium]